MKNLSLEEVDFNKPPKFNVETFSFWNVKNDLNYDCICLESQFTKDEVNDIIKFGRSFSFNKSKTQDGTEFSDIRRSYNSWIPPCDITRNLYIRINNLITEVNEKYFNYDLISLEHLQYTEYDEDYEGEYVTHMDRFLNPAFPGSHRKLSFSIQLTDPSTYEGGDLLLYTGQEPVYANKLLGTINFFPSYLLHRVTPVTKGSRYSLVGWVSGPKFR